MSKQKDKTCVPVVPQATEEQRETLHQKAMGKHIETKVVYEVMLRYQDTTELVVDVRKDIERLDGDPITEEYVEGFSYEDDRVSCNLEHNYREALKDYKKLYIVFLSLIYHVYF